MADSVSDPAAASVPAVVTGLRLKNRYVIERELGRGGFGVVCLARDEELHGRQVVIKVLLERAAENEWVQKKFKQELQALVRIDHPGVVGALDAGEMPDGRTFFVMQFVQGANLRKLMQSQPPPSRSAVANILRQVGSALTAAHEKGVYHRDLKPENIMVQDLGHGELLAKIIDFGIATVQDPEHERTQHTQIAGSVLYMAPEQLEGRPQAASDIYALGVIAYEMLAGVRPFEPKTPWQLLELQKRGVQAAPSQLRPDLPPQVDAIVLKALAVEPRQRPQSALEFADELARVLTGTGATTAVPATTLVPQPSPRPPVPVPRPAPPPVPPRPAAGGARGPDTGTGRRGVMLVVAGLGAAVLALAVVGLAVWKLWPGPSPAPGPSASPVASPTAPAPPATRRELAYFLTVQRFRNGQPYKEPVQLAREVLFAVDDRLRLTLASPQAGHLYVVNEGPEPRDGRPSYNVLHPRMTVREGSAQLAAGAPVQIPENSWFRFDAQTGTERLWLVFAESPVPELEAVKVVANPSDRGVVSDPARIDALRAFLSRHSSVPPAGTEDAALKRTVLAASGDILVHALSLEHQ